MRELDEIFVRNEIRKILSEQLEDVTWGDLVPPSADEFYNTFIGPFVDVFKVAQVAVKDVAAGTLTTIESAFTFNPEKQKQLMDKFRSDREKYKGEMKTAMSSTVEALSSPDAQLIMFMMNPGVYLGGVLGKEVAETAEPVTEFLGDKFGNMGKMMGLGSGYIPAKAQAGDKGPIRGIMDDLKNLFFGPDMGLTTANMGVRTGQSEGLDEIDELEMILREGEEEKKDVDFNDSEMEEMAADWLENSGAGEKIGGYADDIIANKKAEVEAVKAQYGEMLEGLNAVTQAKSLDELFQLIPPLAQAGIDLQPQAAETEKAIQEQKDIIAAGGEEAEKILEDLKQLPDGGAIPDDAPPEAWDPIIEQGVIAAAFGDVVTQAKQQSLGELIGFVAEMPRADLETIAKTGPKGKEFADIILGLEEDLLSM
jgi:hypothetical protein